MATIPPSPPTSRSPSPRTQRKASGAEASTTGMPSPAVEPIHVDLLRSMDAMEVWGVIVNLLEAGNLDNVKDLESKLRKVGKSLVGAIEEAKELRVQHGFISEHVPVDGPLHLAARWGYLDILDYLVDVIGLDEIDCIGYQGNTPLMSAIGGSYPGAVVKNLLGRGAALNITNNHNLTPLHLASSRGLFEMVDLFLERGLDVHAVSDYGTPLQLAIKHKSRVELVKLLLWYGADPTVTDNNGYTLLHLAAMNGSLEIARELLAVTGSIDHLDARCEEGTALHLAAKLGNLAIITLLIEKGANPNLVDKDDLTPLEVAAALGIQGCVEYLLEHTARLDKYADWTRMGITEHIKSLKLNIGAQEDVALEEYDSAKAKMAFDWESTLLEEELDLMPSTGSTEVPRKEAKRSNP